MHILIDTGSSISFISEATQKANPFLCKKTLKCNFILSKFVTGQNMDTLVTVTVTLRLATLRLQHDIHVIRNVNHGVILGWDFLQQHQVVLNIGRGLFCLYYWTLSRLNLSQLAPIHCIAQITVATTSTL